jgi:hypothetical protein
MKPADYESRNLNDLVPEMAEKARALILKCEQRGVIMRPFFTVRGPAVQGRLYRQGRTEDSVSFAVAGMLASGAQRLSRCLKGTHKGGPTITRATPGNSWHQWGEAMDCFVADPDTGKAIWTTSHSGYRIYAEEATALGLTAGYYFASIPDAVHVQLRPESSPTKAGYTWPQIEAAMAERFSI